MPVFVAVAEKLGVYRICSATRALPIKTESVLRRNDALVSFKLQPDFTG